MVPETYMDIISCDFAYDPVRLPLDQDPTQSLYNRKTLETIWETKRHAQNPFTKQWFNAKSVIPQIKLRNEMEDYIKIQKLPECKSSEIDVIEEYAKILEEGEMKQYLDILGESLSENVTTKMQCCAMWKKINLLRMYCQFDSKNTETFRSLHGFRYLNEMIIKVWILLLSNSVENDAKEIVWDVCKEIARVIDVIGLKPWDIYDIDGTKTVLLISGYIKTIEFVYLYPENYMKIESLMLRIFCKIFDEMNAQAEQILGRELYETVVGVVGPFIVTKKLCETNARDISSEDLNHVISILRISWITTAYLHNPVQSQILVDAIIICVAREIDRSEEVTCLSEEQVLEVGAEGQHNSKALELGFYLVMDILMAGGPSADNIHCRSLDIVDGINRIFKHFSREGENEDEPSVCVIKGCNIFECVHFRIAQLGWDISTAIGRMGEPSADNEILREL